MPDLKYWDTGGQAVGASRLSWHLCSHQESPSAHCHGPSGPLSWGGVPQMKEPPALTASWEGGERECIREPWEASCRAGERQDWPSQRLGSRLTFVTN